MSDINAEMARLYLEAAGLVVKLTNFIKVSEIPNSKIYLDAANNFIHRNAFYEVAVNGFLAPDYSNNKKDLTGVSAAKVATPETKPLNAITHSLSTGQVRSYKSYNQAPEKQPETKPPVLAAPAVKHTPTTDDELW